MEYSGELARVQRSLAMCHDLIVRRARVFEALSPRRGERILELGCGGGLMLREIALGVGEEGHACGIDISQDQISAAKSHCSDLKNVELKVENIAELSGETAGYDAAVTIQVLEYLQDIDQALIAIRRTLKPASRFVNLATCWNALFWNCQDRALMKRVLAAFDTHAPHPNLPATIRPKLERAGYASVHQTPVVVLNTSYNENSLSFWLAKLIAMFVVRKGLASQADIDAWLLDLETTESRGESFFSSTTVITSATIR